MHAPDVRAQRLLRPLSLLGAQRLRGVAIYTKKQPDNVRLGIGIPDFDVEGRYLQVDFGKLSVVSLYLPSGSSGPERQAVKFHFMDEFYPFLKKLRANGTDKILLVNFWSTKCQVCVNQFSDLETTYRMYRSRSAKYASLDFRQVTQAASRDCFDAKGTGFRGRFRRDRRPGISAEPGVLCV